MTGGFGGAGLGSGGGMVTDVAIAEGLSAVSIQGRLFMAMGTSAFLFLCTGVLLMVQSGLMGGVINETLTQEAITASAANELGGIAGMINMSALLMMVMGIIVSALSAVWIAKSIARPVAEVSDITQRLSEGDYHLEIPYLDALDEIGQIARAVQVFRDSAVANMREQEQQASREQQQMRAITEEIVSRFRSFFDQMIEKVESSALSMESIADQLQQTSEASRNKVISFRSSSDQQLELVSSVNQSVASLTEAIHEISNSVELVSNVCNNADQNVADTSSVFKNLQDVTNRVTEIIGVISDIAEKTNLLALNATIEAARAGEAGKGFSVVANEVKGLSRQTSESSQNVTELIEEIRAVAQEALARASTISDSVADINTEVTKISGAVKDQSQTSSGIANDTENVANITGTFTENLDKIAQIFEHTHEAVGRMAGQSTSLQQDISAMRENMETFLQKISQERAA